MQSHNRLQKGLSTLKVLSQKWAKVRALWMINSCRHSIITRTSEWNQTKIAVGSNYSQGSALWVFLVGQLPPMAYGSRRLCLTWYENCCLVTTVGCDKYAQSYFHSSSQAKRQTHNVNLAQHFTVTPLCHTTQSTYLRNYHFYSIYV